MHVELLSKNDGGQRFLGWVSFGVEQLGSNVSLGRKELIPLDVVSKRTVWSFLLVEECAVQR